jgi:hypothetical protein
MPQLHILGSRGQGNEWSVPSFLPFSWESYSFLDWWISYWGKNISSVSARKSLDKEVLFKWLFDILKRLINQMKL